MKILYDRETDTLTIIFRQTHISESDEIKEGIIIDYDNEGKAVSIELLDASKNISEPTGILYEIKEEVHKAINL